MNEFRGPFPSIMSYPARMNRVSRRENRGTFLIIMSYLARMNRVSSRKNRGTAECFKQLDK